MITAHHTPGPAAAISWEQRTTVVCAQWLGMPVGISPGGSCSPCHSTHVIGACAWCWTVPQKTLVNQHISVWERESTAGWFLCLNVSVEGSVFSLCMLLSALPSCRGSHLATPVILPYCLPLRYTKGCPDFAPPASPPPGGGLSNYPYFTNGRKER